MTCASAGRISHSRKINLYIIYGSEKAQGSEEGDKEGGKKAPIVSRKIPASDAGIFHLEENHRLTPAVCRLGNVERRRKKDIFKVG